jgi:hypothetical protein
MMECGGRWESLVGNRVENSRSECESGEEPVVLAAAASEGWREYGLALDPASNSKGG